MTSAPVFHGRAGNGLLPCALFALLAIALLAASARAPAMTLPGEPVSIQVASSQRRAEKAFDDGQYDRALWHYRTVLAPAGDKYAHYMIGYLNEHGLGVPRDRARALAWYRLAAERNYEPLVGAYEALAQGIHAGERDRAEAIFAELRGRYGDRTLLSRAIKRNERNLRRRTGTRTGAANGPLFIILPLNMGRIVSGDSYYDAIEQRIELQTELLRGHVDLGELELVDP